MDPLQSHKLQEDDELAGHSHVLSTGDKLLHGQYTIQCYLSSGGFGVTYLARDSLDRKIVIKECFPAQTCVRQGKSVIGRTKADQTVFKNIVRLLVHEARRMARLTHPNIVGVHQVFEENGTAYLALDYINGVDLLELIENQPERLTPDVIKSLLRKTLDAIEYMHESDILHRDISPDNILITEDNEPVLIDFGAAREVTNRSSKALSTLNAVKDGYSPLEFYSAGTEQTPASDLYSLAATFYHVIMGDPPPDSHARLTAIAADELDPWQPIPVRKDGYDHYFLGAIDNALALFPKDRIRSATQWIEQIDKHRRQKTMLAAAQEDQGIESLIRELTNKTNEALQAANQQRRAEEEHAALLAQQKADAEAAMKKEAFKDVMSDLDPDCAVTDWNDLYGASSRTGSAEQTSRACRGYVVPALIFLFKLLFTNKNRSLKTKSRGATL